MGEGGVHAAHELEAAVERAGAGDADDAAHGSGAVAG
jgi:hypothetical protein